MTFFCRQLFVITIVNFKYCLGYTTVNFFCAARNICCNISSVDNTLSKTLSVYRKLFFICLVVFVELFLTCFCCVYFSYFSFNIWHAAALYFDGVTIELFTKFLAWEKAPSYKNEKIILDFRFDINTKWSVKQNNILLSISLAVVSGKIIQSLPTV